MIKIKNPYLQLGPALLLALAAGCDQLGHMGSGGDGAPSDADLQKISYMQSANAGPQGRKLYTHYEEAKSCGDFELATRWNRPPNVSGGPFQQKMAYLGGNLPADQAKNSEIFLTVHVEKGVTLPSGDVAWFLKTQDGTRIQAVETANFLQKEEQFNEPGKLKPLEKPDKPGRTLCLQGVYQGVLGTDPDDQQKKIPLVSVLYAIDRDK